MAEALVAPPAGSVVRRSWSPRSMVEGRCRETSAWCRGFDGDMDPHPGVGGAASFDDLVGMVRERLLPVLWSRWGVEAGSDICAEVEEFAWSNRDRVLGMSNPLGYLYRVSQSKARRYSRWHRRDTFPSRFPESTHEDPQLHGTLHALAGLSADQRASVLLVHGFGWSYDDVAELLGISRAAVTNHVHRGLTRLRAAASAAEAPEPIRSPSHEPETLP